MTQKQEKNAETILRIEWNDGLPHLLVLNCNTDSLEKVPLSNYRLAYRVADPKMRICVNYQLKPRDTSKRRPCLRVPEKGKKCEICKKEDSIFAANLHNAHTKDRGALPAEIVKHMQNPNYLYLAAFDDGALKIGTSRAQRINTRLLEQGALIATIMCETEDGFLIRALEDMVTAEMGIPQSVTTRKKLQGIVTPLPLSEVNAKLSEATRNVKTFIESRFSEECSIVLNEWENPERSAPLWERIHAYPNNLGSGAHDLTIGGARGRLVGFTKGTGDESFVGDLDEIFGVVVEPGSFPTNEMTVQDKLF